MFSPVRSAASVLDPKRVRIVTLWSDLRDRSRQSYLLQSVLNFIAEISVEAFGNANAEKCLSGKSAWEFSVVRGASVMLFQIPDVIGNVSVSDDPEKVTKKNP